MQKIVNTDKAPKAIGPYSQAQVFNNLVFTSGQIPLDPVSGEIIGKEIKTQAQRALENLKAILQAAGADFDSVLKTTCYLKDMNDFAAFNEVYTHYFGTSLPARSCFAVAQLPRDVLCEIEAIAYIKQL